MLLSLELNNFRVLEHFTCRWEGMNVLIGPNNCGKSTVLDALRIAAAAHKYGCGQNAGIHRTEDHRTIKGYLIPKGKFPVLSEYIHTDFTDAKTEIKLTFSNNNSLTIVFPRQGDPYMEAITAGSTPSTKAEFRNAFPFSFSIVPPLGPFEFEEPKRDADYVDRWSGTRRSSRLFRNIWLNDYRNFAKFQHWVEKTWKDVSIERPELIDHKNLAMFYSERQVHLQNTNRPISREVGWAGNGFQVWLQLLTHLIRAENADMVVIDEPEIYLHSELQRQLVNIVRELSKQTVIATHSVEIINEVSPKEILLVDRGAGCRRLGEINEVQSAIQLLGSTHNIQLARFAGAKKVLFVEGVQDQLYRDVAKACSFSELFGQTGWLIIPLGGFSESNKAAHADWAFGKIMGQRVNMAAIFDRDYRCSDEIDSLTQNLKKSLRVVHILTRKELENYLLLPEVVVRAAKAKLSKRGKADTKINASDIKSTLMAITEKYKSSVFGNRCSEYMRYRRKYGGEDISTIVEHCFNPFESEWNNFLQRMKIVPGKLVLADLNTDLQNRWGVSVSAKLILQHALPQDLDPELHLLFKTLSTEL
ncbi:MAG: AAA family ATPase [Candidatus Obscuribacterales bacterium]|nr:AAA family ATPase [Candidatus Obscuribacterales bacterium]